MNNRLLTVLGIIAVLAFVGIGILVFRPVQILGTNAYAAEIPTVPKKKIISVSGEGKYKIKPDVAYVELGVLTQDRNAKKAQDDNKKIMDAIIKAIKAQGLKDEEIQTVRFDINPEYDYGNSKTPALIGYQVNNMVSLTINDMTKVGNIIDVATAAGSNQVNSIRFGLKDVSMAYKNALEKAVADATGKADVLAKSSNIQLNGIIAINEGGSNAIYSAVNESQRIMAAKDSAGVTTPILSGEMEVTAAITMVFGIR